ncbi:hypothetical protein GCM10011519_21540 [Marmoricola endophyticus]|uniref:ATP-grasp domain-containing protein n=1 Tax=Marmoricola endophyticus TaxID=2040280 RepID=A0A917F4B3_9ACTN|nr:hypothetical protein [Marmoricola endophyticus]GGF47187.1 hypothetical protein GCM10011519_21540 [Marmoricola endophyticus]
MRVALVTAAEVRDLDDEGRLLAQALRSRGADVVAAVWDDAGVDWTSYDVAVVRSTWDYAERVADFVSWAQRVSGQTRLANPADLIAWSTDKHYLDDLASAGVPLVPSVFLEPGDGASHELLGVEHVVKPAVSAGSRDTLRLTAEEPERSLAHAERLLGEERSVLVQPYLAEVDTAGETAVVLVDGEVSHAMRKAPLLQRGMALVEGLFAQEEMSVRKPSPAELDVAAAAMRVVADRATTAGTSRPPLYARVDLLPSADGPVVLELELVEPSLFLDHVPGSADLLAEAILAR